MADITGGGVGLFLEFFLQGEKFWTTVFHEAETENPNSICFDIIYISPNVDCRCGITLCLARNEQLTFKPNHEQTYANDKSWAEFSTVGLGMFVYMMDAITPITKTA
jgi:hypothetical protein